MPNGDMHGFPNVVSLMTNSEFKLKKRYAVGMELVDAHGRSWRVTSVMRIGREWSLLKHAFMRLVANPPIRIDYALETLPDVDFDRVKERCCIDVERQVADLAELPEDGPAAAARLRDLVQKATTAQEVYDIVQPDWF